jgi:hypothetical protein
MDATWPIALGLTGIGVVIAIVLNAKWEAERADLRKANALDFAQAKIPNAAADHVCVLAASYLAWFETGAIPAKADEAQSEEELEIPYIGRG